MLNQHLTSFTKRGASQYFSLYQILCFEASKPVGNLNQCWEDKSFAEMVFLYMKVKQKLFPDTFENLLFSVTCISVYPLGWAIQH